MSRNVSDSKHERDLLNRLANVEQQLRELRTLQVQGDDSIQIGYTDDEVLSVTVTPASNPSDTYGNYGGLIGTFMCTLEYDNPAANTVVYGDIDIAVNIDVDSFDGTHNLSPYYGGLQVMKVNDLYLKKQFYANVGYHPIVKIVRLFTSPRPEAHTFYVHTQWRYVGVGKTLIPASSSTIIIPDGPEP